jgi:hypothetical protein
MYETIGIFRARRAALRGVTLAVLLVAVLPACRTARMELPATLSSAERMGVEGRQGLQVRQRIRFGRYETHELRRSWTGTRDRGATAVARQRDRRQEYSFTLREAGEGVWTVSCLSHLRTLTIDARVVEVRPTDESALYCNLQSLRDPAEAWELDLRERRERPLSGTLRRGGERLAIVGTNRLENALPTGSTSGFEIRAGERAVGAVEVINSGAVWLGVEGSDERRSLLAAAAAALLALEDPRQEEI